MKTRLYNNEEISLSENDSHARRRSAFGTAVFGMLIIVVLLLKLPDIMAWFRVRPNRILWESSNISDYTLTVQSIGMCGIGIAQGDDYRMTVHNNQVTNIEIDDCVTCKTYTPIGITVNDLFDQAQQCTVFCRAKFDPKYGYPVSINSGFIESCSQFYNVAPIILSPAP